MTQGIQPGAYLAIFPLIGLFLTGLVVFIVDLIGGGKYRSSLAWITFGGLILTGLISLLIAKAPTQGEFIFGGMLRWDIMSWSFGLIFLFAGAVTALLAKEVPNLGNRGEFYVLLLTSIMGMSLMAASTDLIMLFLALETTSIPLYVLAGFLRKDDLSSEAGFKYFLFGAVTSAVILFGFSLLYGFSGTTKIYEISQGMGQFGAIGFPSILAMIFVMAGICFKIAAAPFHFWAPDVYQGAPTVVTGFLSTASKAAGFAMLLRLFPVVFYEERFFWSILFALISVLSMFFGNLQALRQKNIKRLLAYSSIAQAGYMLIGIAALSLNGFTSIVFYLIAYLVTNLTAFGIISVVSQAIGSEEIAQFAGVAKRSPAIGLGLLAAFLSLAGIPPFAGFVGKILLFAAGMESAQLVWMIPLVVLGIINSIIALYYYLIVIKTVYSPADPDTQTLQISYPAKIGLVVCSVGILIVGILFTPYYSVASNAIASLF